MGGGSSSVEYLCEVIVSQDLMTLMWGGGSSSVEYLCEVIVSQDLMTLVGRGDLAQ